VLGLEHSISGDVAFPGRTNDDAVAPNLWEFNPSRVASLMGLTIAECTLDTATGSGYRLAKQIYADAGSDEGSVPILYDRLTKTIVNNESAEIIRMFNQHAAELGSFYDDSIRTNLYPENPGVQTHIDSLDTEIYQSINNGASNADFSSDQNVYATAFAAYFSMLDKLEALLGKDSRPFLTGDTFIEADLRLYPTLFRHDPVYYLRMKLNAAKLLDYPYLWRWLCRVYAMPGVVESNSLDHCKQGYFGRLWNNVVPLGPSHPMPYPKAYLHPELA